YLSGKYAAGHAYDGQDYRGDLYRVEISAAHAVIELCSVVEAADRLEALAEAYHRGADEGDHLVDYAHGGDGCVAVRPGGVVEDYGGNAAEALAEERGRTTADDEPDLVHCRAEVAQADM